MKRWKFVLSLFLVSMLAVFPLALTGCTDDEEKYPQPTEAFFVNDFADVLSQETEQMILQKGAALAEKTKAQVVVLTVNSLNNEPIEQYALNLGREWGIGDEEDNTGVLLLLAVEERETRIEVGYGLEGRLPDSKAGRFLDTYAIPYFREDNFDAGVRETYAALVNEVYVEFGLEEEADVGYVPIDEQVTQEPQAEEDPLSSVFAIVVLMVFVFGFGGLSAYGRRRGWPIFLMMGNNHHHRGGGFGGGGFRGGGGSFGGGGASRGF